MSAGESWVSDDEYIIFFRTHHMKPGDVMIRMFRHCSLFTMLLLTLYPISTVDGAELYGHGQTDDTLYSIDTVSQTVTPIGSEPGGRRGPDIAIDDAGTTIYMVTTQGTLLLISPTTGLNTGSLPLSGFPVGTDTATALEFVGSTLYGAFSRSAQMTHPVVLGTIDTTTGVISEIGSMAPPLPTPSGGLEYANSTMYTVNATYVAPSSLYTVNIASGVATEIAPLTLNGVPQKTATGLAYADNKMYLIRSIFGAYANLYSVDLVTGVLTIEFDMGVALSSLTSVPQASPTPVPAWNEWGLIILLLLLIGIGCVMTRRQKRLPV